MAKGRFLKSAERACATKARFDTAEAAIAHSEYRFRAYLCSVCHHYHLTSRSGKPTANEVPAPPPAPKPTGPKLGDLDWSPILDPKPKPEKRPPSSHTVPPRPPKPKIPPALTGICLSIGKDRRVLLLVEKTIVKSRPVKDRNLFARLKPDAEVQLKGDRPYEIVALL